MHDVSLFWTLLIVYLGRESLHTFWIFVLHLCSTYPQQKEEILYDIEHAKEIFNLKAHIVRQIRQESAKTDVLESLNTSRADYNGLGGELEQREWLSIIKVM